jgi:hypothetical protein
MDNDLRKCGNHSEVLADMNEAEAIQMLEARWRAEELQPGL